MYVLFNLLICWLTRSTFKHHSARRLSVECNRSFLECTRRRVVFDDITPLQTPCAYIADFKKTFHSFYSPTLTIMLFVGIGVCMCINKYLLLKGFILMHYITALQTQYLVDRLPVDQMVPSVPQRTYRFESVLQVRVLSSSRLAVIYEYLENTHKL